MNEIDWQELYGVYWENRPHVPRCTWDLERINQETLEKERLYGRF